MGKRKGKSATRTEPSASTSESALPLVTSEWETCKNDGNSAYARKSYQEAIEKYTLAIECLLQDETVESKQ